MSASTPDEPWTERLAAWLLNGPLTAALLALCGAQLAAWVPHYLTWPWFADHDVFATLALGWERGQLPYRDLAGNNFPGTIYLFWILGKLFGWGRTGPLWALDVAFILTLGATMLAWSRRRFGRLLPGVVGHAAFLSYYLSLGFGSAAQRDWHGPFFIVEGMLLTLAYPGRWSRRFSALTSAIAFAIRPQVVVFFPAVALAVARGTSEESDPGSEASLGRTARVLFGWGMLVVVLIVLAFTPLMMAGVFDDFLRSLRLTFYGGRYNKAHSGSILSQMLLQFLHLEFDLVPVAILLLAPWARPRMQGSIRVWMLAYLGAWFYKPLSPVPFPYLEHPLTLVWAINIAVMVALLLTDGMGSPALRLVAVLLAVCLGVRARPEMSSVGYARQGIEALRRGEDPPQAPLGMHIELPVDPKVIAYPWDDYRETLAYLRTRTGPDTPVANLLHVVPALNGPAGRPTPLPAESLAWLSVKPDDEPAFARALERAPANALVVWTPAMGKFVDLWTHFPEVERLAPLIRRDYEPVIRFGDVEVWKKKSEGPRIVPNPPPGRIELE